MERSLLHAHEDALSFGDYTLQKKEKVEGFKLRDDTYNLKTHNEVTRLEKNSILLFEAVPGATVHNLAIQEHEISFSIEGLGDTSVTMQLEGDTLYRINDEKNNSIGSVKSNLSGKINFSLDLNPGKETRCIIKKL